ncbi:MAG: hypothetical protein LBF68_06415 [Christensenellaceae bacterium]|jgi:tetratricopeptide (TPR) repeat protein|nr:hypothetical protein [Christensenellaceae bacterium]
MAIYSFSDDSNFYTVEAQACLEKNDYFGAIKNYKLAIIQDSSRREEFLLEIAAIYENIESYQETIDIYVSLLEHNYCKEHIANIARNYLKVRVRKNDVLNFLATSIDRFNQYNHQLNNDSSEAQILDTEFLDLLKDAFFKLGDDEFIDSDEGDSDEDDEGDEDDSTDDDEFDDELDMNISNHLYGKMLLSMMQPDMISISQKRALEQIENLLDAYLNKQYEAVIQIASTIDESSPYLISAIRFVLDAAIFCNDDETFKTFATIAIKHDPKSDASFEVRIYKNKYSSFFERVFKKSGCPADEIDYFSAYVNRVLEREKYDDVWGIVNILVIAKRFDLLPNLLEILEPLIPDSQLFKYTAIIVYKMIKRDATAEEMITMYREFYFTDINAKCVAWLIKHEHDYPYDWTNYFFDGLEKIQAFAVDYFNKFVDEYIEPSKPKAISPEMFADFKNTFEIVCQYKYFPVIDRLQSQAFVNHPLIKQLIFDFLKVFPYNEYIDPNKANLLKMFLLDDTETVSILTNRCYFKTRLVKPPADIISDTNLEYVYRDLVSSIIIYAGIDPDYMTINKLLKYINNIPDVFSKFSIPVIVACAHYCLTLLINDRAKLPLICTAHSCSVSSIEKCLSFLKFDPEVLLNFD